MYYVETPPTFQPTDNDYAECGCDNPNVWQRETMQSEYENSTSGTTIWELRCDNCGVEWEI